MCVYGTCLFYICCSDCATACGNVCCVVDIVIDSGLEPCSAELCCMFV